MKGYIYIISNKSLPGLFKIGRTTRDPKLRAIELSCTGLPYPYVVEYSILVDDHEILEHKIHALLLLYKEGKEWFNCSIFKCLDCIRESCYNNNVYSETVFNQTLESYLFTKNDGFKKKKNIERLISILKIIKRRKEREQEERSEREISSLISKLENQYRKEVLEPMLQSKSKSEKMFIRGCILIYLTFIIIYICYKSVHGSIGDVFLTWPIWLLILPLIGLKFFDYLGKPVDKSYELCSNNNYNYISKIKLNNIAYEVFKSHIFFEKIKNHSDHILLFDKFKIENYIYVFRIMSNNIFTPDDCKRTLFEYLVSEKQLSVDCAIEEVRRAASLKIYSNNGKIKVVSDI